VLPILSNFFSYAAFYGSSQFLHQNVWTNKLQGAESKWFSLSQGIIRILWKPKVHYRVHNSPPLFTILSNMNQVHALSTNFIHVLFNIIIPSAFKSQEASSLQVFTLTTECTSTVSHACHMTSHLIGLRLTVLIFSKEFIVYNYLINVRCMITSAQIRC
jgi:hypothetical protein